jgi:hypothetical protein
MQSKIIKLKIKENSSKGAKSKFIKEIFLKSCRELDPSIFEPLIDEEQYFQDIDKYRFLQSLKMAFEKVKAKRVNKTIMLKGKCELCFIGHTTYQFYSNNLECPEFTYLILEEDNAIKDIFACNSSKTNLRFK